MLFKAINYLRGSVRISIEGACIERFLNVCAANSIPLWAIKRLDIDRVEATVTIGGFFSLRRFARKCMCRIKVKGKSGAPFAVKRYGTRYALWGGAAICGLIMWGLAGFVWTIGISGSQNITQQEIMQLLAEGGLKIGAYSAGVDTAEVKSYMLSKDGRLSYIAINIWGSHAQVVVGEKQAQPVRIDANIPCDFISDKTGVVESLQVRSGLTVTAKGKTIQAGEPIAIGTMTSQLGEKWLVHADADVTLKTWKTEESVLSTDIYSLRPTGKSRTRTSFIIGNSRFKLYIVENIPFAWYDKKIEKKPLELPDGTLLPITIVKESFFEMTAQPLELSTQKAADILQQHLQEKLAVEIGGGTIVSIRFEYEKLNGKILGRLYSECIEKCGLHVPIGMEGKNDPTGN